MPSTAAGEQQLEVPPILPSEVIHCLGNARFLHLATCHNETPHVSLMNYTYLPSTPFSNEPTIIMTSLPSSRKTADLFHNPRVSIVVHDWVSHRPPTLSSTTGASERSVSPERSAGRSSLASLLYGLNSASISRISVSLNGTAKLLSPGSEEEAWCRAKHKENNTFGDTSASAGLFGGSANEAEDSGAGCYIDGQDIRVIVVNIKDGRISDWKGTVKDWALDQGGTGRLTNGVQGH